jgi:aminoglycoside phosphotransferase (APT) family kinase protein
MVVRIREHYAVKFGRRTSVQEGMNMLFVAQSTSIPVPKVYAIFEHEHEGHRLCFIVMEYIAGKLLIELWESKPLKQPGKKREIATTLRGYMNELRSLPSHGYYGSLWRGPYRAMELQNIKDQSLPPDPMTTGPHDTEQELCDALWGSWVKALYPSPTGPESRARFVKRWRRIYRAYFKGDGIPVFTHGDFERVNIIVADDGRLVMIDWEFSGWYPKFWESCHAANLLCYRDDWAEWMDYILGTDFDAYYPLFGHHWKVVWHD